MKERAAKSRLQLPPMNMIVLGSSISFQNPHMENKKKKKNTCFGTITSLHSTTYTACVYMCVYAYLYICVCVHMCMNKNTKTIGP